MNSEVGIGAYFSEICLKYVYSWINVLWTLEQDQ